MSHEIKKSFSDWCDPIAVKADISKEADCIKLIEETVNHYGRIDVLVNNAGCTRRHIFYGNFHRRMVQDNRDRSYRTVCMQ